MKFNKILVIISHPDDEVLGCAGFIKKLTNEGKEVNILYLNDGCNIRPNFDKLELAKQMTDVCQLLGVANCYAENYRTAEFERYPQNRVNNTVSDYVKRLQPDTILTHDAYDLHKDHRITHEAVMVASRFKKGSTVKNLLTFPVISSSDISPKWKFAPNYYVDISDTLQTKMDAMKLYVTEYSEMMHNRGDDAISTWARFFGLQSNMMHAEAFTIIRGSYD